MIHNVSVNRVIVLDKDGNEISTMYANRALKLIHKKQAKVVNDNPLTIRLLRATANEIKGGDAHDK